jgi:hypothetical protein
MAEEVGLQFRQDQHFIHDGFFHSRRPSFHVHSVKKNFRHQKLWENT